MDVTNFYSGFGILLVYFTLIWQNTRQKGIDLSEQADALIASITASNDEKQRARKAGQSYLRNPLNLTMDIISIAGILAFVTLIIQHCRHLGYSVGTIVLLSIFLMHLVISLDLWRINIKLCQQNKKLARK